MGVSYKLTPPIIQFIIDQKKIYPELGCRELREIIEKAFRIQVSKSSINSVIKKAQLSNPVGRPIDIIKNKQFKIPVSKKIQITKDIAKFGEFNIQNQSNIPEIADVKEKISVRDQLCEFKSKDDIVNENEDDIKKRKIFSIKSSNLISRMMLWDTIRKSIFENVLRHKAGLSGDECEIIDGLFCLKGFNFLSLETLETAWDADIFELWAFSKKPTKQQARELLNKLGDMNQYSLDIYFEASYLLSEVRSVRIYFENETRMVLNGRLNSIFQESRKTIDSICMIDKVYEIITQLFVIRNQTFFIYISDEAEVKNAEKAVQLLLDHESILKIELVDEMQNIIGQFSENLKTPDTFVVAFSSGIRSIIKEDFLKDVNVCVAEGGNQRRGSFKVLQCFGNELTAFTNIKTEKFDNEKTRTLIKIKEGIDAIRKRSLIHDSANTYTEYDVNQPENHNLLRILGKVKNILDSRVEKILKTTSNNDYSAINITEYKDFYELFNPSSECGEDVSNFKIFEGLDLRDFAGRPVYIPGSPD